MGKWIHVLDGDHCRHCGPVQTVVHQGRKVCPIARQEQRASPNRSRNLGADRHKEFVSTVGCCEVCGATENLVADHDHACCAKYGCKKCLRGVLCGACNVAIGFMADEPKRLRAAADYLERQNENNPRHMAGVASY